MWVFCSSTYPCTENQGDCDYDYDCQDYLRCGQDNCPSSLVDYDPAADCCFKPQGDFIFIILVVSRQLKIPLSFA